MSRNQDWKTRAIELTELVKFLAMAEPPELDMFQLAGLDSTPGPTCASCGARTHGENFGAMDHTDDCEAKAAVHMTQVLLDLDGTARRGGS